MYNPYSAQSAMQREIESDAWIQRNVPGGLNSPLGRALDNYLGGNPNATYGQQMSGGGYPNPNFGQQMPGGGYPGYGAGYAYPQQQQRRW